MGDYLRLKVEDIKAESAAEQTFLFEGHGFSSTPTYAALRTDSSRFVVGRKGSGKTAHRLALQRLGGAGGGVTDEIVLTDVDLSQFSNSLQAICDRIGTRNQAPLIRNLWRFTITIRLMRALLGDGRKNLLGSAEHGNDAIALRNYLESIKADVNQRRISPSIAWCAESQSNCLDAFLQEYSGSDAVDYFPTDQRFRDAEQALARILDGLGEALVLIDDLDYWLEHSTYKHIVPFIEGLIRAATDMMDRGPLAKSLRMKVFFPADAFYRSEFRQADKEKFRIEEIRWNSETLQALLARRIAPGTSRTRIASKESVNHWLGRLFEGWPKGKHCQVADYWNVQRPVLKYILFHTQYRPRDLLFLMNAISRIAESRSPQPQYLESRDVTEGIRSSSNSLARRIIEEYEARLPNVGQLIHGFVQKSASMPYETFRELVAAKSARLGFDADAQESVVEDLYEMGFVGKFVNPRRITPEATPHAPSEREDYAAFSYGLWPSNFLERDQVVIHPVFWRLLEMNPPREFIRGVIEPEFAPGG